MELIGLSKEELTEQISLMGEKPFRAKQVWHWLYCQGAKEFDDMTNLSKDFRLKLKEKFTIFRPKIKDAQISIDDTRKWLLEFDDGKSAECVYIPEEDRGAVCISSQIGCKLGCKFCRTGSGKFERNMTVSEIISQFIIARDEMKEWPSPSNGTLRMLSNIVVMGMGEPLDNYDNVSKALKIIMDGDGIALSKRRITLSTAGIVPFIDKVAKDLGVKLAISLHAPNDELREKLMPINKKYSIRQILNACKEYQKNLGRNYITFEYLMLKGVNDKPEHARELIKLIKEFDLGAKFNLIPFNPWEDCGFEGTNKANTFEFSEILEASGFAAPIRISRGRDILAACGQLKSKKEN